MTDILYTSSNTVIFNLLNACAICQGGHSSSYAQWTASCQAVHLGFPDQVATRSINVPEWAFINVSEHSTFNLLAARDGMFELAQVPIMNLSWTK